MNAGNNTIFNFSGKSILPVRIKLHSNGSIYNLPVEQIEYLEADINYTVLVTHDKRCFVSSRTIKHYENMLNKHQFVRVHKSHIINLLNVESCTFNERNAKLKLKCGKQIEVSRRKFQKLMQNEEVKKIFQNRRAR